MSVHRIRLIMWKEFLQLRRDPMLLRVLFLMPVMQLIFFGYVVAADVTNLRTAIVDLDHSSVSRALAADVDASDYFTVVTRPAAESELKALVNDGVIKVAVVIPEGTAARLTRGESAPIGVIVDGAEGQTASVGAGYLAQIVGEFNAARMARAGLAGQGPGVDARVRVMFNPSMTTVNTMIPGLIAAILMISISVIMSQAVVRERESGTLEQMFVTPIRRNEYLVGKVIPYALLAFAQSFIVALVGVLWFRVPFHGSLLVVVTGLSLFMLTCLGIGLLISLASRTRHQAQQTVMFIMFPTTLMSGFIFPVESMPRAMQWVAQFIPLTHALVVLRSAFVKNSGFSDLAVPLLALLGFGVVIFGAAVVLMQRRLAE